MEHIGIVGLGRMGSAIAQRLSANDTSQVIGWTRSGRTVDGITSAPDLASLVAQSDTILLSLFDNDAVADVLDAALALDLAGKQIIDTSTVSPRVLQDLTDQIEAAGATIVDAPIAGGPELVLAGQCGVFMGGTDKAAEQAKPVLNRITERVFHVGPLGAGQIMKMINNGMLQVYVSGLAELLPVAKRAGMRLDTTLKILSGGPAGLPMIAARLPKILGEDPEVGFAMSGTFKDNAIFREIVDAHGLSAPLLSTYAGFEEAMDAAGLLEEDPAALVRWAYEQGGDDTVA